MKKILSFFIAFILVANNTFAWTRVSSVTQSFSTPVSMDVVSNTMTQHATTNITISTSNLYTAAFTNRGSTSTLCTGVLLYITAVGTAGTVTVNLQENSAGYVDIAGATVSIATTSLKAGGWNYFRIPPTAMTSTTASYYRWRVVNAGATGTTSGAADSAGTALSYYSTDDRFTSTIPTTTDDIVVAGQNLASVVLTLNGTGVLFGSGVASLGTSTEAASIRCNTGSKALDICYGATVSDDTTANVGYTIKGDIIVRNGGKSYRNSGPGVAYPASRISIISFDESGTSGSAGFIQANGGIVDWYGTTKLSSPTTYATYVSGTGTTGDPMITTADIGTAGDEILIFATSDNSTNYNECERRDIKVRNSSTSFVLSPINTGAGGADSALTYTHNNNAKIINIERNINTTSTSSTAGWFYQNWNTTSIDNTNFDWCSFEYVGSTAAYKQAFFIQNSANTLGTADYCALTRRIGTGFDVRYGISTGQTYTGIIVNGGVSTNTVGALNFDGSANIVMNDCIIADEKRVAVGTSGAANIIFNRLDMNACGKDGGVTGTFYTANGCYGWTVNDSNFNACRNQAVYLSNAAIDFYRCNFGKYGKNQTTDIGTTGLNTALFHTCWLSSDTTISGYTNQYIGSIEAFHKINNIDYNHRWYTPYGKAVCTNNVTGITSDTTTSAAGHPCVRIDAEDSTTGFTWSFQVPTSVGYSGNILAFLQRNATFDAAAGSVVVEVWLEGSTSADSTYTMSTTTGQWEVATAAKTYSGTIPSFSTIKVIAKTTTSGASVYIADLFGGTNTVTDLETWFNGQPSNVMYDQIGNPASIWNVQTSTFTTAGTAGKALKDTEVETKNMPAYMN